MKQNSEDACIYKRERLFNECVAGHKQPVHHRYCAICGKQIINKYSASDWEDIELNQTEQFKLIQEISSEPYNHAFISVFNNNLLFIQDNRKAYLIRNIIGPENPLPQQQPIELGLHNDSIRLILTLNNSIFIQCGTKLYNLDWVSVLKGEFSNLTEIVCKGDILDTVYHKHLYIYTEKNLFVVDDSKSVKDVYNAAGDEDICHVSSYLDSLLIACRKDSGAICLRTFNAGSTDTFTQDVILRDYEHSTNVFSAVGKDYYAVCIDGNTLKMGKLAGLQSARLPHWTLTIDTAAYKIFFIKNIMYVVCENRLLQWDLDNFTNNPSFQKDNLALAQYPSYFNIDNSRMCVVSSQGKNSYIAILDTYLTEISRAASFPTPLMNFMISDGQIYAITKFENTTYVYGV